MKYKIGDRVKIIELNSLEEVPDEVKNGIYLKEAIK